MSDPYYADATVQIFHGDCLDVLRELPDASVDAVVTDPPYGLEFMGKEWDRLGAVPVDRRLINDPADVMGNQDSANGGNAFSRSRIRFGQGIGTGVAQQAWHEQWATECLRVLKPGGHMLAFGGTRTSHRLACAVEDAGFEIRDSIAWLYGSGFPKSLDVSKAIDKAAGAEREVVGTTGRCIGPSQAEGFNGSDTFREPNWQASNALTAPATPDAERWQGWGTALKPAHEPIVVARKPLAGTVAANVQVHGTGALNVDGCRVEGGARPLIEADYKPTDNSAYEGRMDGSLQGGSRHAGSTTAGRWPANVVLDESQAEALDEQSGELTRPGNTEQQRNAATSHFGSESTAAPAVMQYGDTGGASRFFYTAKAASSERVKLDGTAHPTVKPLALMRWLVRLVTPPGGTVLEPFAGSGTTVEACILEGFACIAIEREADYLPLIRQRIHRRRDPVEAVRGSGEDAGLFDLLGEEPA